MISPYIGRGERKISLAERGSVTRGYEEKQGKKRRREVKNNLMIVCKLLMQNIIFRAVVRDQAREDPPMTRINAN